MHIGLHSKIKNRMANSVDPDETAHKLSSGSTLFVQVCVSVCWAEKVKFVGTSKF